MIRLLIFAALVYVVYTLARMWLRSLLPPSTNQRGAASSRGEAMAEDPQCGTFVPTGESLSTTIGGKTYYFCSKACRDAYLESK